MPRRIETRPVGMNVQRGLGSSTRQVRTEPRPVHPRPLERGTCEHSRFRRASKLDASINAPDSRVGS
jgi:hypothetical protein